MIIKHGGHIHLRISGGAQGFVGLFFLDYAFCVLIGWADNLIVSTFKRQDVSQVCQE